MDFNYQKDQAFLGNIEPDDWVHVLIIPKMNPPTLTRSHVSHVDPQRAATIMDTRFLLRLGFIYRNVHRDLLKMYLIPDDLVPDVQEQIREHLMNQLIGLDE